MNLDKSHLRTALYSTPGAARLHRRVAAFAVALACCGASAQVAAADQGTRVSVRPLSQVSVTLSESAPATVVSRNHASVSSQLSGVISSIDVEVGERAGDGEVLATLDCTEYRQNLARAEARLDAQEARRRLADEQLKRALKLIPTRNISEEQVNQRRAEYDAATAELLAQRAQIAIAERQVDHCRIESPFDGVVTRRHASLGDYVSPGSPIADVLDTEKLEVSARVPQQAAGRLDETRLVFRTDRREYSVRLRTVLPLVDESSRSREARLTFDNEPALAGTPGRLVWVSAATAVPAHLLVARAEGLGVFIAEDERARFIALPGALAGRPADTDLDPSTLIVTEGRHQLEPGGAIDIVDE